MRSTPLTNKEKTAAKGAAVIAARVALKTCQIPIGADFHTLSSWQVDLLLVEADRQKYRKPTAANGSRARYFHDKLQRRARLMPLGEEPIR